MPLLLDLGANNLGLGESTFHPLGLVLPLVNDQSAQLPNQCTFLFPFSSCKEVSPCVVNNVDLRKILLISLGFALT